MLEELIKKLTKTLDFLDKEKIEIENEKKKLNSAEIALRKEVSEKTRAISFDNNIDYPKLTQEERNVIENEIRTLGDKINEIGKEIAFLKLQYGNREMVKQKLIESIPNFRIDQVIPDKSEQAMQSEQKESLQALVKSEDWHQRASERVEDWNQKVIEKKDHEIEILKVQIEQLTNKKS